MVCMQIFLFRSTAKPLYAFTPQSDGGNLPENLGPWQPFGGQAIPSSPGTLDPILPQSGLRGFTSAALNPLPSSDPGDTGPAVK